MEECWQVSPKARPNFSEIEYALEVILSHRAEVNLSNQQTSGDNEDTFYLPMADESPSPMIRRESSLADKINLVNYNLLTALSLYAFKKFTSISCVLEF